MTEALPIVGQASRLTFKKVAEGFTGGLSYSHHDPWPQGPIRLQRKQG